MVQLVLGWPTCRDPTMPPTPWRSRPGPPTRNGGAERHGGGPRPRGRRPDHRGETGYERAVREAIASERAAKRNASCRGDRRVIASVEGKVGAVAADSLVIEVGGIGYRVFAAPAILASAAAG